MTEIFSDLNALIGIASEVVACWSQIVAISHLMSCPAILKVNTGLVY